MFHVASIHFLRFKKSESVYNCREMHNASTGKKKKKGRMNNQQTEEDLQGKLHQLLAPLGRHVFRLGQLFSSPLTIGSVLQYEMLNVGDL